MESAKFLSTLSLRRATTRPAFLFYVAVISIHALLAESDTCWRTARLLRNYFYPRSPCGERHSLSFRRGGIERYFYPRSPCGERPGTLSAPCENCQISIHALLAESDAADRAYYLGAGYFYPRSPCGERLCSFLHAPFNITISIHALLAESDQCTRCRRSADTDFYPRSPCGERPAAGVSIRGLCNFYPRSPCGERRGAIVPPLSFFYFYPRSPCGERLVVPPGADNAVLISIHALLAESDKQC